MTTPSTPTDTRHRTASASVRATGGVTGPAGESADLEIVASSESIARDGGLIPVDAWELDSYRSNPVVLLAHGRGEAGAFPIARAAWTTPDTARGELRQGWEFHRESPESQLAAKLYRRGWMRTASVAFRLHAFREPDDGEAEALQAELDAPEPPRWIAEHAELLEVSAVSVPSDPDALALDAALNDAREAGLDTSPLTRRLRALRRACRRGDARACRRLEDRRSRDDGGERVVELELGREVVEVALRPEESAEDLLDRVMERAGDRLEERARFRGWGDRVS